MVSTRAGPADDHDHAGSGGHGHGHNHGIGAGRPGATAHVGRLRIVLAMVVAFLLVQVGVGVVTGSLAVWSDAGHMATDGLGIAMSLAAISAARSSRSGGGHRTFGWYRLEILAALANSVLLIGVGVYVLIEAAQRFGDPPDVATAPVFVVGVVGLALNLTSMLILRADAADNLNVRGAYLEVVADALGSVAVIVSAVVMAITDWAWVDPLIGAAIGLFILPRAWRLGRDAVRVLVQAAPRHLDPAVVHDALADVAGVTSVHDFHLWTLTSDMDVVTAHLGVGDGVDTGSVLASAQQLLATRFDLTHATLQVERDRGEPCDHPDW